MPHFPSILFRIGFLACALAGCQASQGAYSFGEPAPLERSALSDYLAGQQARFDNQTVLAADYYLDALEQEPANSTVLRDRAYKLLIADGRFKPAETLADSLSRGSLSYNLSRMMQVLSYMDSRRYGKALEALDGVTGTGFDLLLKPLTQAWASAGQGDKEKALNALSALKKQRAFRNFYSEHEAFLHAYFGDWGKADAAFAKALKDGGVLSIRGIVDYAGRLSKQGQQDNALAVLDQVLERAPQIAELQAARRQLVERGRLSPYIKKPSDAVAEALYRTATELVRKPTASSAIIYARMATYLRRDFVPAYILIADVYAAQGRLDQALATIEDVPSKGAMNVVKTTRRALYLDRLERPDDAAVVLASALEEDPNNKTIQMDLADLYRRTQQFTAAIPLYTSLIERSEAPNWVYYYGRGICFEQSNQFPLAEADFRKALEIRPEDPFVLNYLGYSLLDRGLKIDEAIAMIDKAVAARPNDGYIVDSQGWAAYQLGDYERAVTLLERAVTLVPGDPTINEHLGDAYWKAGRFIEARFKWRQVLSLEPADKQVPFLEEKIDLGLTLAEATRSGETATR